jgi:ligand-binding SRPBCC domain-containing protein
MVAKMETSIEIAAPIEQVFVFLSNPKNHEKILSDTKIEGVSKQPIGVGTRYRISAVISGRKVGLHWHEIVEFEQNRRFVDHEVKGGPTKKEEWTFLFETTDKGTKVTINIVVELPYSVFGKFVELFFKKGFARWVTDGLQKAKEILEAT